MGRRRIGLATCILLAAAAAGCDAGWGDDPYGNWPCRPGHERFTRAGCRAPVRAVVIDGQVDDWAGLAEVALETTCAAPPCDDALVPAAVSIAGNEPDTYNSLRLRVRLANGAAPRATQPSVRYSVAFAPTPELPVQPVDTRLVLGISGSDWIIDGVEVVTSGVGGPRWAAEFTSDGFEIETWALPATRGAALVTISTEVWVNGGWTTPVVAAPIRACWVAGDPARDACREEAP